MHQAQTPQPAISGAKAQAPSVQDKALSSVKRQPSDIGDVSQFRLGHILTDDEREAAIKRAGEAMEVAYAKYTQHGCFSDLGHAHHLLILMGKLVEGRSPEYVARLEAERGLG